MTWTILAIIEFVVVLTSLNVVNDTVRVLDLSRRHIFIENSNAGASNNN